MISFLVPSKSEVSEKKNIWRLRNRDSELWRHHFDCTMIFSPFSQTVISEDMLDRWDARVLKNKKPLAVKNHWSIGSGLEGLNKNGSQEKSTT